MSLISVDFPAARSLAAGMDPSVEPETRLTSTQRGQIAESIVAAQLMLASNGRLSPFRAVADDDGTDLLVTDKATGRVVSIQVKARFASEAEPPKYVQFDTRLATFKELGGGYVLAVLIDPENGALWRGWMVPAGELKAVSNATTEAGDLSQSFTRIPGSLLAVALQGCAGDRAPPDLLNRASPWLPGVANPIIVRCSRGFFPITSRKYAARLSSVKVAIALIFLPLQPA